MDLEKINIITGIIVNFIIIIGSLWSFSKFILPKLNKMFPFMTHSLQKGNVNRQIANNQYSEKSFIKMLFYSSAKGFLFMLGGIGAWIVLALLIMIVSWPLGLGDNVIVNNILTFAFIGFISVFFFVGISPEIGDFCEGIPPLIGKHYNPSSHFHRFCMAAFSGIILALIWGVIISFFTGNFMLIIKGLGQFMLIFGGIGGIMGIISEIIYGRFFKAKL